MVLFHLVAAYRGIGISRDQHLGTAVAYARSEIDLLRPIIIGANVNGAPTPLEFPLWQALTAMLMKAFGLWLGWGNVTSLFFHLATLWPIFQLAKRMFSARAGWWAMIFFAVQPLSFVWGGMASADAMSAALAVWFVYLACRMMQSGHPGWWCASLLVGCLSSTTKAPFFLVAGLTTFLWLLKEHRRASRAWLQLTSVGMISVVAFWIWNHHANNCYEQAELPYYDLRIGKNASIMAWWFGDASSRLNLKSWIRGAWRASIVLTGSLGMMVLPLIGWFLNGGTLLRLWVGAAVGAVLIFTNLVLVHWHYYYIFSAPLALLAARGAAELEPALWRILKFKMPLCTGIYLAVALVSLAQGLQGVHINTFLDRYPIEIATSINQHTAPHDKLVLWGGGWNMPLLRMTNPGLSIQNWDYINDATKLGRLKELGYNRLVLINNSPLLTAVNTASGGGDIVQRDLPAEVPTVARRWKVLHSSSSLLILDIPK
jgi:hypothetical protein